MDKGTVGNRNLSGVVSQFEMRGVENVRNRFSRLPLRYFQAGALLESDREGRPG